MWSSTESWYAPRGGPIAPRPEDFWEARYVREHVIHENGTMSCVTTVFRLNPETGEWVRFDR